MVAKADAQHSAAFKARMRESQFTPSEVKKLGFELKTAAQNEKLGLPAYAGFLIPYFDAKGKKTKFYRVRYVEETRKGFAAMTDAKALRYAQPGNTLNEVYMPPLMDWSALLADVTKPLVITEGELKAAVACAAKLPTVGLGGVWNFRAASHLQPRLAFFDTTRWDGRVVYVLYDSDAGSNPQVMKAEQALCDMLTKLGALPHIVRLPALSPPHKTGLDDFIISEGVSAVLHLLKNAEEYGRSAVLHKLNTLVAYVRDPGIIYDIAGRQRITAANFMQHAYSTWTIPVETDKGMTEKPAAPIWLRWPQRHEVPRVVYEPGKERFIPDTGLNTWRGWGVEPTKGNITPWRELLDFIFKDEGAEARAWFEKWCAYPLQNPGTKMFSAVALWGVQQGTGKTLVGHTLMRIHGVNAIEINDEQLQGSFNDWAVDRTLVVGDEITGGDKRGFADRRKGMITRKQLTVNAKYVPAYVTDDRVNYLFTSNHPDAFFIEDSDRRYFIVEVTGKPLPLPFYQNYDKWLTGDGPAHLFHHLLSLPLGDFNPRAPAYGTKAKVEMLEDGRSDLDAWAADLLRNPAQRLAGRDGDLWTANELLTLYDPQASKRVTASGLGKALKRVGAVKPCSGTVFVTRYGSVRLYAVRNLDKWRDATNKSVVSHYEASRGMPDLEKKAKFKANKEK